MAAPQPIASLALGDVDESFEHGALPSFSDWESFDEETSPWCVDHGSSICVMKSSAIQEAIRAGGLSQETKVWRDGRACWQSIFECEELTCDVDAVHSHVRRVLRDPSREPQRGPITAAAVVTLLLTVWVVWQSSVGLRPAAEGPYETPFETSRVALQ